MKICVLNITPVPPEYRAASRATVDACCAGVLAAGTELAFRAPTLGTVTLPHTSRISAIPGSSTSWCTRSSAP